ncbi:chromatin-remodeling complex subunit ies6 [Yamadazyma tenuis]|uniref:Vps72/YL1 C-terminal domain-containing protein n=1 Tax=Candida tenuis (strain ATCC 10573 / BCRC 21748 / CBS 615 / JCM 9827 / NBRC 10315 / NRRL Y-1498 / VKM Y-70) TaxID=590646 RepID=G3B5C6_CANTC|nr:uncharacterized protein CANTEDRAFT_106968 [Yamadazyma tenuis ATCC 10573]EGV63185.1 hypothetical protein CANTEDRAFT_106968 [Yamadazyma tenuis ATCC 10573]WEJ96991.1 chromatin-remodeling complex subunit ies6 [Yamadazyma tenuis]
MADLELSQLSYVTTKHHSFKSSTKVKPSNKRFKPARQLISDEIKYLQTKSLKFDTPTLTSITAPPTLKPSKKYCDITGLEGKYRSPSNNLRFYNVEIYQEVIRHMPPGLDQEYLSLRGANVILK